MKYIVACQAHPAFVKIRLVLACLFHFNSLLVCIRLVKALRTACVLQALTQQVGGSPLVSGLVYLCTD